LAASLAFMTRAHAERPRHSVFHASLLGALVLAVIFLLSWAGEALGGAPPTRAVVSFFGPDGVLAPRVLLQGVAWAIAFGALAGALLALFGNLLQDLGRRRS